MNLGSRKLAYLYLPALALLLCLVAVGIDLYFNRPVQTTAIFVIPFMIILIIIGVRKKVWKDSQ